MTWEPPPDATGRPATRRTLVVVVVVVGIALVAAVVLLWPRMPRQELVVTAPESSVQRPDAPAARDLEPIALPPAQVTDRTTGGGPMLPGATGLTIVTIDDVRRLQFIDTASGDTRRLDLQLPAPLSSDITALTMFEVGDHIVVDSGGAVATLDRRRRAPTVIANRHRAIPTVAEDVVWVADTRGVGPATATLVELDGDGVLASVQLPAQAYAVAGTPDRLIVSQAPQTVAISIDGSARRVAPGPAIASDGTHIAWLACEPNLSCAIVMGTVDDPDQARSLLTPADVYGDVSFSTAAFSPDGTLLAVPLYRGDASFEQVDIVVIDARTGVERARIAGTRDVFFTPLAWSRDSRWLAIGDWRTIRMWSVDRDETVELDDLALDPVRGVLLLE